MYHTHKKKSTRLKIYLQFGFAFLDEKFTLQENKENFEVIWVFLSRSTVDIILSDY